MTLLNSCYFIFTGNLLNGLIACRAFFVCTKLPDGHDEAAIKDADNDLCNLVAGAISVGYWAPVAKVCVYCTFIFSSFA